jgi:hypothetical protein
VMYINARPMRAFFRIAHIARFKEGELPGFCARDSTARLKMERDARITAVARTKTLQEFQPTLPYVASITLETNQNPHPLQKAQRVRHPEKIRHRESYGMRKVSNSKAKARGNRNGLCQARFDRERRDWMDYSFSRNR